MENKLSAALIALSAVLGVLVGVSLQKNAPSILSTGSQPAPQVVVVPVGGGQEGKFGVTTYSGLDNLVATTVSSTNFLGATTGTLQVSNGTVVGFARGSATSVLDFATSGTSTAFQVRTSTGTTYCVVFDPTVPGGLSTTTGGVGCRL